MNIVVIGTGLIGGSMALSARGFETKIIGVDASEENLKKAMELGEKDGIEFYSPEELSDKENEKDNDEENIEMIDDDDYSDIDYYVNPEEDQQDNENNNNKSL